MRPNKTCLYQLHLPMGNRRAESQTTRRLIAGVGHDSCIDRRLIMTRSFDIRRGLIEIKCGSPTGPYKCQAIQPE